MRPINVTVVNNEEMSSSLGRYIPKTTDILFLSCSNTGRFVLATDAVDYFIFEKHHFDKKKNQGVFKFLFAEPIMETDTDYVFNKFVWEEESGFVSMFFGVFPNKYLRSRKFIYNEHLYERTARPFCADNKLSENSSFNGTDFECTIQNHTLDKALPVELKQILFKNFKRTFENGVFRFYEYYELERNASEFLDANKDTNVSYGMIFNPRLLYNFICEAYGVDNNSNAKFNLVFRFDDDCILKIETKQI